MPILKELEELIHFIRNCSGKTDYIPQKYQRLTDKYGFHDEENWLKNKNREIFIETIFHSKDMDAIRKRLRRIGKIRFDLDGLKSVNDIGSHRLGDALLDQVASALSVHPTRRIYSPKAVDPSVCNKKISAFCEFFDVKISVVRAGGDELDVYVERVSGNLDDEVSYEILPNMMVNRKFIFLLRDIITLEVSLNPFTKMDFRSSEVQSSLGEYGRALLEKAEKSSGEKFFFTPSVSAGECILWDILVQFIKNSSAESDCLPKERLGDILMGMTEDISGALTTKRNIVLKEFLWNSPSPSRNMQALMLTRGKENKDADIRFHKLQYLYELSRSLTGEIFTLQSLKNCTLAEISEKKTPKKNHQESKDFLREIDECTPFVRDRLLHIEEQLSNILYRKADKDFSAQ
jgi:hypothetical protein